MPAGLAPGGILDFVLPVSTQPFNGWTPHTEVGASEGGGVYRPQNPVTPVLFHWDSMRESLKKAPRAAPCKLTEEIGKNCIAIYMNICVDNRICNINSTFLRSQVLVA